MLEYYHPLFALLGLLFLFTAAKPILSQRLKLPITVPMWLILIGAITGYLWTDLPQLDPVTNGVIVEKVTEFVVLISLVCAGLKLDNPFDWQKWRPTLRLLCITMPVCILFMVVMGQMWLGLSLAAAVLLGAVLAPTDPVLASSVQVGAPNEGKEDSRRFTLTTEAGLNDGLAFPFVYLAIKLNEALSDGTGVTFALLWQWFAIDVLWKILAGVLVGVLVGKLCAWIIFNKLQTTAKLTAAINQGYTIIALTMLSFAAAELIHSYGFIAVFVAAITFRHAETDHHYHKQLHDFAEQSEGLIMTLVIFCLGLLAGQAITYNLLADANMWLLALLFLLLVRPVAGLLALTGLKLNKQDKYPIAILGIRGIGTLFYLSYGLNHGAFDNMDGSSIWYLCVLIIILSIFIHGLSAERLMQGRFRQPMPK